MWNSRIIAVVFCGSSVKIYDVKSTLSGVDRVSAGWTEEEVVIRGTYKRRRLDDVGDWTQSARLNAR